MQENHNGEECMVNLSHMKNLAIIVARYLLRGHIMQGSVVINVSNGIERGGDCDNNVSGFAGSESG